MLKVAALGLFGLFLILGCTSNMKPRESGNSDAQKKVLVAGESSAFKEEVVAKLIGTLGTTDWYFRVVGLDRLEGQETGQYGAVLLVTAFKAGRIDERVRRFLGKDPMNAKVIVFFTRGTEDPMPEWSKPDIKVDAVSSASRNDRVEERAGQLAALIRKRF
jgi:hypothetical protein